MRTLPLRLAPINGESLPGYLARYSHTYQFPPGDLLRALGLDSGSGTALAAGRYGAWLSQHQIEHVATATGIDPATIERMLLWRYADRAFQRPRGPLDAALAAAAQGSEVLIHRSRFCPHCLHEHGAWLLRWQLRWSFACTAHRVLLLRRCPTCAAVLMSALRENWPSDHKGPLSDPTRCVHRSNHGLCRGPLEHAATPTVNDPTLAAQRRINLLLDGGAPNPTLAGVQLDPPSYLRDLSKLCTIVHRCTPTPRSNAPRHGWGTGSATTKQTSPRCSRPRSRSRTSPTPPSSLRRFASSRTTATTTTGVTLVFMNTGPMSEPLKAALQRAITQAIWTSASWQLGVHPGAHHRAAGLDPRLGPQHVPQLFWAEDYHREIAELLEVENCSDRLGRRFCSMLLTRMLCSLDWDAAARYLDLPDPFTNNDYNTTFAKLRSNDQFTELASRVKQIANRQADGRLIDYKERRARPVPGSNNVSHGDLP